MPSPEIPAVGKSVVLGYDANDKAYPIIGIRRDPTSGEGMAPPAMLSKHPRTTTYPNHFFTEVIVEEPDAKSFWKYMILPGPWSTSTRQDWDSATVTVKTRRNINVNIVKGETLVDGIWTKNYSQQQNDDLIATEVNESRAVPGNIITAGFYDSETDTVVSETRQLVAQSTADPTITSLYVDFRREPIDSTLVTKFVTRTYPSDVTSKTFTEYEPDHFTYPALLISVQADTLYALDGSARSKITPNIEAERPILIAKRIVRTFTTSAPTDADLLSGIYQIRPYRNRYNGFFFNLETGPVLQDTYALTFSTGNNDPVYGPVSETYTLPNSVPTYSSYVASRAAGEWKTVYRTSKKIAKSLYMLQAVSIPIL